MKSPSRILKSLLVVTTLATPLMTATPAHAEDGDCFPLCQAVSAPAPVSPVVTTGQSASPAPDTAPCTNDGVVSRIENLNEQVKPLKDIVGYVRSPQGLALKLVNDHVIKMPPWVGFAIDPVGTIKGRAMDEVRTRTKAAAGLNKSDQSCAAVAAPDDRTQFPIDSDLTI